MLWLTRLVLHIKLINVQKPIKENGQQWQLTYGSDSIDLGGCKVQSKSLRDETIHVLAVYSGSNKEGK